jgi:hypothetical protein
MNTSKLLKLPTPDSWNLSDQLPIGTGYPIGIIVADAKVGMHTTAAKPITNNVKSFNFNLFASFLFNFYFKDSKMHTRMRNPNCFYTA